MGSFFFFFSSFSIPPWIISAEKVSWKDAFLQGLVYMALAGLGSFTGYFVGCYLWNKYCIRPSSTPHPPPSAADLAEAQQQQQNAPPLPPRPNSPDRSTAQQQASSGPSHNDPNYYEKEEESKIRKLKNRVICLINNLAAMTMQPQPATGTGEQGSPRRGENIEMQQRQPATVDLSEDEEGAVGGATAPPPIVPTGALREAAEASHAPSQAQQVMQAAQDAQVAIAHSLSGKVHDLGVFNDFDSYLRFTAKSSVHTVPFPYQSAPWFQMEIPEGSETASPVIHPPKESAEPDNTYMDPVQLQDMTRTNTGSQTTPAIIHVDPPTFPPPVTNAPPIPTPTLSSAGTPGGRAGARPKTTRSASKQQLQGPITRSMSDVNRNYLSGRAYAVTTRLTKRPNSASCSKKK